MVNYIEKKNLTVGEYYVGRCRNATVARWNGTHFIHWRTKFRQTFAEQICCPEDDNLYDVFEAHDVAITTEEIPLRV